MSLHARLLELLSTPAARAASEDDTRRAVARLLGSTDDADLHRIRAIVGDDAQKRHGDRPGAPSWAVIADCILAHASQHRQARALLNVPEGVTLDQHIAGTPRTCSACKDIEARAWRRHAEIELGDDDSVRTAPDQQLRRALTHKIEDQAHTLDVMAECAANLEHTIRVMAQAAAEGDFAQVRMHYEHAMGPAPDLSVERLRGEVARG